MRFSVVIVLSFCFTSAIFAQKKNADYQLHIRKALSEIKIDGVMSEADWAQADVAKDFFTVLPMDTSFARVKTEIRMSYDEHNLYIIAVCYHDLNQKYMVESLKRDFTFGKNDNFIWFMDPFEDQTNGFSFGSNAAGAQWDGMMYEGGKMDLSWDNKWVSVVKNYPDRWVHEASIPFKSIRYKKGIKTWGVNFSRLDIIKAEKSSWAPVPRQFPTASLAYTGTLIWDEAPPDPGINISLIPYVLTGLSKNYGAGTAAKYQIRAGGDAKVAVTSSLNLDLTVNPDFSQVEVDRQVTNLDRFELFFPEKRQFFLENGDHFSNFGYSNIRPFFSRRIGLNAPILAGVRLSGKLNKNWRLGVMDIQTGKVDSTDLPAQNFAVVALQRRVFSRSNIGLLFVNKDAIGYHPTGAGTTYRYNTYNRNIGLEYNLASPGNQWTGKFLMLKSFSPAGNGNGWVHAANILYASRQWNIGWQHEYVSKNYIAEVGYVPRKNYLRFNPSIAKLFFPAKGILISHGPKLASSYYFDPSVDETDRENLLSYVFNFRNQAYFESWVSNNFVKLLMPFDPTNIGKDTLARGSRHHWNTWGTTFISKPQSRFTYGFATKYGGYFANGKLFNVVADAGYRFQPYVNIAINISYNNLELPAPWNRNEFWLVGPRLDVTMTNTLFFTSFVQYNGQQKNINLNTRLQWRYRPASDLYIVYTDNYVPYPFSIRNRAFVIKFNYWWNL